MIARKTTLALFIGSMFFNATWAADGQPGQPGVPGSSGNPTDSAEIIMKVGKFDGTDPDVPEGGFVLIQGLDDMDLGTFNPTDTGYSDSSDFCIYGSGVGKDNTFDITLGVAGNGVGDNAFILTNGTSDIAYTAAFEKVQDDLSNSGNAAFVGLGSVGLKSDLTCDADNAKLTISVKPEDASNATSGEYKGVITLTYAAN